MKILGIILLIIAYMEICGAMGRNGIKGAVAYPLILSMAVGITFIIFNTGVL